MECNGWHAIPDSFIEKKIGLFKKLFHQSFNASLFKVEFYTRISLIACGTFPLAANIFAIFVLQRPQLQRQQPTFRLHLLILAVSEIFYCAAFINFWIWDITARSLATKISLKSPPAVALAVFGAIVYAAQTTRNWIIAAISAARCEVITRPLTSLRKKFITTRRVRIFAAVTLAVTLTISFLYYFLRYWTILCLLPGSTHTSPNATNSSSEFYYKQSLFSILRDQFILLYFRGLPTVVVMINTIIMVAAINCKRTELPQNHTQAKSATFTLIGFTTLFSILEGFGFAFYLVTNITGSRLSYSDNAIIVWYIFDKYLLLINSMTNVIAYFAFNRTFRCAAKELLCARNIQ